MGLQWDSMLGRGKDSLPTLGLLGKGHMLLPGKLSRPAQQAGLMVPERGGQTLSTEHISGRKKKSMARTTNPPQ